MIQKPYSISVNGKTIDAVSEENLIRWKVSGAVQKSFSIEIKNNSDSNVVYSVPKTDSYLTQYYLPKGVLLNGYQYKIAITVFDEGNNSAVSDSVIFQTSSIPIVTLSPIGTNGTIGNNSYIFSSSYFQAENVPMKSYIVFLYDSGKNIINKSTILTDSNTEYMFTDLQSEKNYYVEFQITSSTGLTGSSGLVSFNVLYTSPYINTTLTAYNVENAGIQLNWRTVQIIGVTIGETSFINDNELDVTNGKVYFDEGFNIGENFTLKLWIRNPMSKKDLLTLKGENGLLKLQYHTLDECFHLTKVIDNGITTNWISSPVSGGSYFVCIQQIENNINLIVEPLS